MSSTNMRKVLVCVVCVVIKCALAQEGDGRREQECYNYAGGHVYPGEAFRVPVSDHSLHLSKAKSETHTLTHCTFPL